MSSHRTHHRRSGFVLFVVMALLAIATVLVAGWVKIVVLENKQAHAAENRLQADWLAESALERAGARLIADRDYKGETWQVSAADMGRESATQQRDAGVVVITVQPVADRPSARQVRVQADFPAADAPAAGAATHRASKQIVFDLAPRQDPDSISPETQSTIEAEKQP